jgi:cell division protein FtsB
MKTIISKYLLRSLKTISIGAVGLYLGYHLIQGENGALSYMLVSKELEKTNKYLTMSKEKRKQLEHRVSLLRPDSIDLDMLTERARVLLNYGRDNEIVVFYD